MTIAQCKAARRSMKNSNRWKKRDPAASARREAKKVRSEQERRQRGKK